MSITGAVGVSYTGNQVSVGTLTDDGTNSTFNATATNDPDTLTIDSVNGATVGFTYKTAGATLTAFGTVIANDSSGFVISYINGTTTTNYYVSNTAQPSFPASDTAKLPDEYRAPAYAPPCYCAGTLIRTATGEVAVEDLVVGDQVVTVAGTAKPVEWIGTRSYSGRFFRANPDVWPVRFSAGSLGTDGEGRLVPARDLAVSPNHAMLIDGVLVAAGLLVNGTTITRDTRREDVTYFHVQLPEHEAIWAENAASETFVDDGSRGVFHNADSYTGPAAASSPVFCAPRVTEGADLEAIRRRLAVAVRLAA